VRALDHPIAVMIPISLVRSDFAKTCELAAVFFVIAAVAQPLRGVDEADAALYA
jgi:hypothetical protein